MVVAVLAIALSASADARAGSLNAGVAKADITPQTGYYLGGWTRADRVARGQHTRLYSRAMVLERDGRKVALVAIDLFMVPGGMVKHIGDRLAARGFSERNILISASHTHSGPGGYANFETLNTAAPSMQTIGDPSSFAAFFSPAAADPQLYAFLTTQIADAIARADDDRAPAEAGWGSAEILGLTRNRSLEAHLANHGIVKEHGEGREADDPDGGYAHTIDPAVNVLRIDKVVRRHGRRVRVPIGAWSTFADHGTVTKSSFQFYNGDHHASAMRVFEERVRRAGKVPAGQEVLNVYGNSNEGDMSAGLDRHGPAASDYVGRVEAAAMYRAWIRARDELTRTPAFDLRWTRMCFCGQEVGDGERVADQSQVGAPFLTGSEEGRGPLFDVTGQHFEGQRSPVDSGPHGHKLFAPGVGAGGVPRAVPLLAVRVGRRMIVSVPGEGTKEVGARIRAAAGAAVAGSGVERIVVSGLANEFVLYFTTPEEYDRQHYEGGNTHFGEHSATLLTSELARLAGSLGRGEPAPEPFAFDPTNGVQPTGAPYPDGASTGTILEEPAAAYGRLERAELRWQGGPRGLDRPVGRAFVIAERREGERWVRADDDLGLAMLWRVDDAGRYALQWEIPRAAPRGTYRLVVEAKRYRLVSREFAVNGSDDLRITRVPAGRGRVAVAVQYPEAVRDVDLTYRPEAVSGGAVRFRVGDRTVRVSRPRGESTFSVAAPQGVPVSIEPGGARDRFFNVNGERVELR